MDLEVVRMKLSVDKIMEMNNITKEQVELLILKMVKEGYSLAQIGQILRDQYGILDVREVLGIKLKRFLEKKGAKPQIPDDLKALFKRYLAVKKHLLIHKKDKHSKRGLLIIESRIKRLIRYYKEKGELDPKFRFDKENVALYLK